MNKTFLILFVFSLIVFTSCSSDDDNNHANQNLPDSYLDVNDEIFELKSGIILNYGNVIGSHYNFDIALFSETFNTSNASNPFGGNNISGIFFELFTTKESNIGEGTYRYSQTRGTANTFTISEVVVDCVYSPDTSDCQDSFMVNSGTLTVNLATNQYDLMFNVSIPGSGTAKGKYNGTLNRSDINRPSTENNYHFFSQRDKFEKEEN